MFSLKVEKNVSFPSFKHSCKRILFCLVFSILIKILFCWRKFYSQAAGENLGRLKIARILRPKLQALPSKILAAPLLQSNLCKKAMFSFLAKVHSVGVQFLRICLNQVACVMFHYFIKCNLYRWLFTMTQTWKRILVKVVIVKWRRIKWQDVTQKGLSLGAYLSLKIVMKCKSGLSPPF